MSPDGSVVLGFTMPDKKGAHDISTRRPFLWRDDLGFVDLQDYVESLPNLRYAAKDIQLMIAGPISADGTTVIFGWQEIELAFLYNPAGFGKSGKLPGIDLNELGVKGTIKAVSNGKWTVTVSEVIAPTGKATPLSPPRPKVVLISKGLTVPTGAKVGAKVRVIGADAGQGKPLTARTVELIP